MSKTTDVISQIMDGLNLPKQFLIAIFGEEAYKELTGIIGDNSRLWRLNNQMRVLKKAETSARKNGLTLNQVKLSVLVPLLQNVSLESDDFLQSRWSELLVNASISEDQDLYKVYVEILKGLSHIEVKILQMLKGEKDHRSHSVLLKERLNLDSEKVGIYFDNLIRNGLIVKISGDEIIRKKIYSVGSIGLTTLGESFIAACTSE